MRILESLQKRLRPWSPEALQLQPLTVGRVLTGEFPITAGSPEEEMLKTLLERAERRAATEQTGRGAID